MNIYKLLNKNRNKTYYVEASVFHQETLDKRKKKSINYKMIQKEMTLDIYQLEDWSCWPYCPC